MLAGQGREAGVKPHDMAKKNLLIGGPDELVDFALKHKSFALSYKLADLILTEGGKIKEKSFSNN